MNDLLSSLDAAPPVPPPPGGAWRATFIVPSAQRLVDQEAPLLVSLREAGFALHVLAPDDGALERLELLGALCTPLPPQLPGPLAPLSWLGALPIIQAHLIEHPAAMVHAMSTPLAMLTALSTSLLDEPTTLFVTLDGALLRVAQQLGALPDQAAAAVARGASRLGARVACYVCDDAPSRDALVAAGWIDARRVELLRVEEGEVARRAQLLCCYDRVLSQRYR